MTLIFNNKDTVEFLLPREKSKFLEFLSRHGFNPKMGKQSPFGEVVFIDKEYQHYKWIKVWEKFTGYDKILKKLLSRL